MADIKLGIQKIRERFSERVNNSDWKLEANEFLHNKYSGLQEKLNPVLPSFLPELNDWESRYFMLGLEQGLFTIDCEGYVQSCFLPSPVKGKQKITQLFWTKDRKTSERRLFREGICQLATLSYLVIRCKCDKSKIKMEPKYKQLLGAVDIVIESTTGKVLVCCEVKSNGPNHKRLVEDFKYCCRKGRHGKESCPKKENHPKYDFCNKLNPEYFLAVSPEKKQCFKLKYNNDKILLEEVSTIPDSVYR